MWLAKLGSWPFDLWSPDLSCPTFFFCRILYSIPHLSISWKKKVRYVIPSAGAPPSMLDSKCHTDLSIFGNLSKSGSLISTPRNLFTFGLFTAQIQRSSCEWQKGAKEARFSENVSQISHLFIPSSKYSILTAGITTQFTRWGMGKWPGKFEPYHWEHL